MLNLTMPKLFFDYFNGAVDYLRGNYPFKIKTDYIELLFPVNINYHETHHERPNIPYVQAPSCYVKNKKSFLFSDFTKRVFNSQKNKTL